MKDYKLWQKGLFEIKEERDLLSKQVYKLMNEKEGLLDQVKKKISERQAILELERRTAQISVEHQKIEEKMMSTEARTMLEVTKTKRMPSLGLKGGHWKSNTVKENNKEQNLPPKECRSKWKPGREKDGQERTWSRRFSNRNISPLARPTRRGLRSRRFRCDYRKSMPWRRSVWKRRHNSSGTNGYVRRNFFEQRDLQSQNPVELELFEVECSLLAEFAAVRRNRILYKRNFKGR